MRRDGSRLAPATLVTRGWRRERDSPGTLPGTAVFKTDSGNLIKAMENAHIDVAWLIGRTIDQHWRSFADEMYQEGFKDGRAAAEADAAQTARRVNSRAADNAVRCDALTRHPQSCRPTTLGSIAAWFHPRGSPDIHAPPRFQKHRRAALVGIARLQ